MRWPVYVTGTWEPTCQDHLKNVHCLLIHKNMWLKYANGSTVELVYMEFVRMGSCQPVIWPSCLPALLGTNQASQGYLAFCLTSSSGEPGYLFKCISGFFREASFAVLSFFHSQVAFVFPFSLSLGNLLEYGSYWAVLPAPSLKVPQVPGRIADQRPRLCTVPGT